MDVAMSVVAQLFMDSSSQQRAQIRVAIVADAKHNLLMQKTGLLVVSLSPNAAFHFDPSRAAVNVTVLTPAEHNSGALYRKHDRLAEAEGHSSILLRYWKAQSVARFD